MIRVAAVADVHMGPDAAGTLRPHLTGIGDRADVLVIAGDLTRHGDPTEAAILAAELRGIGVPTFAVLGNHDLHLDRGDEVRALMEAAGVRVLEGEAAVVETADGRTLGVAGSKGFGGGFPGACGHEFGEPEMKAFIRHTREVAERLETALRSVEDADARVAAVHYSPISETLQGERLEIYPFLGSYLLGEAIDRAGADLVLHGHAHIGVEKGTTPEGIHVRNVAQPVLRRAYTVYTLEASRPPRSTSSARP